MDTQPALAQMDTQRMMLPMSTPVVEDTTFALTPDYDTLVAELGDPAPASTALGKSLKALEKEWRKAFGKELNETTVFPEWFTIAEIFEAEDEPEWPTVEQIWNALWPPALAAERPVFDMGYLSLSAEDQHTIDRAAAVVAEAERVSAAEVTQTNLRPVAIEPVEPLALPAGSSDTQEMSPVQERALQPLEDTVVASAVELLTDDDPPRITDPNPSSSKAAQEAHE